MTTALSTQSADVVATSGGPGPLAGLRVVELCQVLSGPMTGMLLAELGADVIKVEHPDQLDYTRTNGDFRGDLSTYFHNVNRGKRSVTLDAIDPRGRDVLAALIDTADVVVQNMRPGKVAKLGADPATCIARNPGLVYASISGFGSTGPASGEPVYDYVIQAVTGVVDLQENPRTGERDFSRQFVADKVTAAATVQGITAALLARERDPQRRGQHVEVSMLEAMLNFFWVDGMMKHTLVGAADVSQPYPGRFYRVYPTTDGAVIVMPVMPPFDGICRGAGHPEWADDPRWSTQEDRLDNMEAFIAVLSEAISTMTTDTVITAMLAEDVPIARIVPLDEVHEHPQIQALESIIEHEVPQLGRIRQPRPPWRFDRTEAHITHGAPALGEDTDTILTELGYTPERIAAMRADRVVR